MRKFISFLMLTVLMVLLTACGGTPTATPTSEPATATKEIVATEEAASTDSVTATDEAVATEEGTATEESASLVATEETSRVNEVATATEEVIGTDSMTATDEAVATEEISTDSISTEEAAASGLGTGTTWTCPTEFEGQTLSVYNWATYIGESTIDDFKKLCSVEVKYDVYDSDESAIARLQQGNPGYDVAFPTDYAVSIMRRQGLLEEIDFSKVPNFANIDPAYTNQDFDPDNKHSVPYLLGTTGIAYRKAAFPNGITTWKELFEFDGRVAWLDNSRSTLGAALVILGYDPNTVDTTKLDEARDYLIEHSKNVVTIAADDGDAILVQGEVDAAIEYGGDMFQQIQECQCDDFGYVAPTDGAILDITSVVLLKDGPNKELAEIFIDFLSDPHVAAHNTNQLGYSTPNKEALAQGLIDQAILDSPALTISAEAQKNGWFIKDIGDDDILYTSVWDETKVNIGR